MNRADRRRRARDIRRDPSFLRSAHSALFVIEEAERLGLRFQIHRDRRHIEVDYPLSLPQACQDSLKAAIVRHRETIAKIIVARDEMG